ncbi:hypothetical protein [Alteriqipengyuania lutimaris]|uniref:hypothetical protein n=1 Tax=Alteriqipengyuania lutimaris TaxID=1538146 RepID=UPI001622DA8E|nr:hypothetical protein [Alteriqipengyuania lutimaris]MBB3032909.1 hypothetical protein [Alteriqipengyuania lutimaris]
MERRAPCRRAALPILVFVEDFVDRCARNGPEHCASDGTYRSGRRSKASAPTCSAKSGPPGTAAGDCSSHSGVAAVGTANEADFVIGKDRDRRSVRRFIKRMHCFSPCL